MKIMQWIENNKTLVVIILMVMLLISFNIDKKTGIIDTLAKGGKISGVVTLSPLLLFLTEIGPIGWLIIGIVALIFFGPLLYSLFSLGSTGLSIPFWAWILAFIALIIYLKRK